MRGPACTAGDLSPRTDGRSENIDGSVSWSGFFRDGSRSRFGPGRHHR